MAMKAFGRAIVQVLAATLFNPSVMDTVPFTDASLCITKCDYFHLMTHYRYQTMAMIEYMANSLGEFHSQKDVFS
jgi:hypothetical protein